MLNFKKLSIIIVNYQSEAYLQKCLAALFLFRPKIDTEVIIVNNDAGGKLDKIKEKSPPIVLIDAPENKGFGAACNLGVKNSRGDLLFFLNPDTEILGSLNPIIEVFEKNPKVGVLGPKLLGADGRVQEWSTGAEISLWDLIWNNLGWPRSRKIWGSSETIEASWVSGATLFTPRKIFSEIGGFDENFFMYFEDNDFCQRVRRAGKKIIYFPVMAIRHFGGKSLRDEKNRKKYYYQSQDYFFQKHCGGFQVFWLKVLRKFF